VAFIISTAIATLPKPTKGASRAMSSAKQRKPRKQKRRQRNAQFKHKLPERKSKRTYIEEPRPTNQLRFLTRREVVAKVRMTYPSIWKKMRQGTFPRAHEMGLEKRVVWFEHEIEAWMFSLPIRRYLGDKTEEAANAA
jgi:predicted DNA-binding transcriptional regulator AlpA